MNSEQVEYVVGVPLVHSSQEKSSPSPWVQDGMGDHAIQEQDQVPHNFKQDQGQAEPSGDGRNTEARLN